MLIRACTAGWLRRGVGSTRAMNQRMRPALATTSSSKRSHMNHGNPDMHNAPPAFSGPRRPMAMGFESARHTGNVLRLLEASHGSYYNTIDTLSTVWHPSGQVWKLDHQTWKLVSPTEAYQDQKMETTPRLLSLQFSDDRTAMAKVVGSDGLARYLSLLRLDTTPMNDGWSIFREVQAPPYKAKEDDLKQLQQTLVRYLQVEHGGGGRELEMAIQLFDPQASLLAVGMEDMQEAPTDWSSPVGSLLEISLETYLNGVEFQTPHEEASKAHDQLVGVDVIGNAAMATVRVGNGSQTLVFEDHLLLGKQDEAWKILSKTFSPQPWPHSHSKSHSHSHAHSHSH